MYGETIWNKLGLGQGSRNDTGREQATISGRYLSEYRQNDKMFDLVLSSPLIRARETAEIVCKIVFMDELKELDVGLLSVGKTEDEMRKDSFYDQYYEYIDKSKRAKDPIKYTTDFYDFDNTPMVEHYEVEIEEHLRKRFAKVFDFIKNVKESKILIVSHNGPITNGMGGYFNVLELHGNYKYGSNCHISFVTYEDNIFTLVYGPSTAHFKIYDKDYSKK